ncbi:g:t/u mismatch-specific uracil/thymine dna-glycosylase [hydrocarbon metagenome]|uniref:G:t/u mismatch-specific uracil/thymine dna-glycosylase n=1 Tax=hydrocarbon metagenome TaxID=938273 RepID=A0A0W8E2D2_9ZZZZ
MSQPYQPLPDYLKPDLKVLFVGFNPSIRSGELGHHFASPNNRFWKILYESGLTPRKYSPAEDALLLELGYGLTNIAARPTRAAADVDTTEYDAGRELLLIKVRSNLPRVVCFVGKGVYQIYTRKRKADWGFQSNGTVPGVMDFVAPSSSGLVRMSMEQIVGIYRLLNEFLRDC